ncbi:MAG: hypothetical protein ABR577_09060 [Pyrinomonadaceae bacterium]
MQSKSTRFDLEWWVVPKRLIYAGIGLLVFACAAGGAGVYVWKYGNPFSRIGAPTQTLAGARFISFEGDVRVVRATTRETVVAGSATQLYPGDTVQTGADGRARIGLADGSTLLVRPNTTSTLRANTGANEGQKTNVRVAVASGQISYRTEQQPDGATNVVETRQTENRMASQTGASFAVNPDQTEEIRVGAGTLETTTRDGGKTTLRGGEYIAVNASGNFARRERLLDVPAPLEPRDLQKILLGANGAADVALRWQHPAFGQAAHYRVEVATSPFFVPAGKVFERDQLVANNFNASDLRQGVYFWRVRATAASGQTSDWSDPQKFIIAPNGTGQLVPVSKWSTEHLGGNIYIVRGRAEPGTTVNIGGRETLVAGDAAFQLQITAPEGAREVTVEARDPQGNKNQYRFPLNAGAVR